MAIEILNSDYKIDIDAKSTGFHAIRLYKGRNSLNVIW